MANAQKRKLYAYLNDVFCEVNFIICLYIRHQSILKNQQIDR